MNNRRHAARSRGRKEKKLKGGKSMEADGEGMAVGRSRGRKKVKQRKKQVKGFFLCTIN